MTRKHFAAIAAAMYAKRPRAHFRLLQWSIDCNTLVDVFHEINPRFDRVDFLKACNGE